MWRPGQLLGHRRYRTRLNIHVHQQYTLREQIFATEGGGLHLTHWTPSLHARWGKCMICHTAAACTSYLHSCTRYHWMVHSLNLFVIFLVMPCVIAPGSRAFSQTSRNVVHVPGTLDNTGIASNRLVSSMTHSRSVFWTRGHLFSFGATERDECEDSSLLSILHTYMHIHTCADIHAHTYMHIHTYTYMHACTHTCTHTCTYIHAHTYMPVWLTCFKICNVLYSHLDTSTASTSILLPPHAGKRRRIGDSDPDSELDVDVNLTDRFCCSKTPHFTDACSCSVPRSLYHC